MAISVNCIWWCCTYICPVVFQMDPLSAMGSLSLGVSSTSHTPSMQGFPSLQGSAFSNPQSPAKAFSNLPNPNPSTAFPGINPLSSQLQGTTRLLWIYTLWSRAFWGSNIVYHSLFSFTNAFEFQQISWIASQGPLSTSLTGLGSGLGMPAVSSDPFGTRKMSTPGLNPPTFQQSKMKACKWWCGWESARCLKLYFLSKLALSFSQKSFWDAFQSVFNRCNFHCRAKNVSLES